MRIETLRESERCRVALTSGQAEALASAGQRLASDSTWWGQSEVEPGSSVIECTPAGDGFWTVRVVDAIGVVVVGDTQLVVQPKIPLPHLLYLLEVGGYIPRVSENLGASDLGASLWRLVARWCVASVERVLRRGLHRDYHAERGLLAAARGQVLPLPTARAHYAGHVAVECRYDEFEYDSPLNRTLKKAAQVVAGSPLLDHELRRRAFRAHTRMEGVGELESEDCRSQVDRNQCHYRDAVRWARHVLLARGRGLGGAGSEVWTFLIRTPEAVEAGIRGLLQQHLGPQSVAKRGKRLEGTQLTINPDLVTHDDTAVADVKYKRSGDHWDRPDLYQLVAFATTFRSRHGALINFSPPGARTLPVLQMGDVRVRHLAWPADPALPAEEAAATFARQVGCWLQVRD